MENGMANGTVNGKQKRNGNSITILIAKTEHFWKGFFNVLYRKYYTYEYLCWKYVL